MTKQLTSKSTLIELDPTLTACYNRRIVILYSLVLQHYLKLALSLLHLRLSYLL